MTEANTEYVLQYRHNGSLWATSFFAADDADAAAKVESLHYSSHSFGRDPLAAIDLALPCFYQRFEHRALIDRLVRFPGVEESMFDDPSSAFFPSGAR